MAPTRELVVQIGKDVKRFARQLNLTCVCAYGGAALGTQISELKRGTEARPSAPAATNLPCFFAVGSTAASAVEQQLSLLGTLPGRCHSNGALLASRRRVPHMC